MSPSFDVICPWRVWPVAIRLGTRANSLPSTDTGKLNSNLSVVSLKRMVAFSKVPRSITNPPEVKVIPAPASPLLTTIILSLITRLVDSITD